MSAKVLMEGENLLQTVTEYRKGILFIRLIGTLTKKTISSLEIDVDNMIKDNQIRNVVINLNELNYIDMKGVNILFYIYELSKNNKGKVLLCEPKNEKVKKRLKNSRVFNYIKEINNELVAFDLIKI